MTLLWSPDTTQDATNTNNSWDLLSPVYSVALIRTIATTNAFRIGIDVNSGPSIDDPGNICTPDDMAAESLELFQVILNPNGASSILTQFVGGDPNTDPTRLCNGNPGGGFADNSLLPIILTGLDDADEIQFRAILRNGGGGKDSFFIIQQALDVATLRVVKEVVPAGDNFDLAIDGPDANDASGINVGDGGSIEVVDGDIGMYSFSESDGTDGSGLLANYATALACVETGTIIAFPFNAGANNESGDVTLASGDDVTCTFTNTLIPPDTSTLTLVKQVESVAGTETFGLDINGPGAADASDASVADNESIQVVGDPGDYIISESDGTGMLADFTSVLSCNGGTVTNNTGTSATVTLVADDNVTCTFTNTEDEVLPPPAGDGLITCDLGAVTPLVRAEGVAELTGDIIIVCHTIPAGAVVDPDGYIEVNVTASLNVSITNNRDYNGGFQDDTTDAVLVINENNCGAPTDRGARMDALGVTDSGFEAGCTPPDSDFQDPQFGVLVTNNRLEWTGVQVPIPGFGDFPEWTTIRLTSMRGNASELGIPDVGNPAFAQIQATVTINGESAITLNTNEANIGLPLLGLISEIDEPASGLQCEDDGDHAMLTINEGFPTAFKTIGTASFTISGSVQVENGYPAPDSGTTTAAGDGGATEGGATQSTHFLLTFFNIPEGVRVGVEDDPDCTEGGEDSDHLVLDAVDCDVNGDDCGGAAPISEADDPLDGSVEVDIDGGSGWIGYEVIDDWTIASEDCEIDIWFAWTPDTENDLPAPGTGQLSVSFAPLSTVGTSSEDTEPVPRFLDGSGSDPENIVTVVRCTSTILFPYVTNQQGFDTGLVRWGRCLRSPRTMPPCNLEALARESNTIWAPEQCPQCAKGVPLIPHPGA